MEPNELRREFERVGRELHDALVFEFLDNLRESGVTNMFGAGPYLVREFGMSIKESHEYLRRWMDTYSARHFTH